MNRRVRVFYLVIFIVWVSNSQLVLADGENGLASLENFQSAIASKWEFRCQNEELRRLLPSIESRARAELMSVIYDGLKRIHSVNPRLVSETLTKAAGQRLIIECVKSDEAYRESGFGEYRAGRIKTTGAFIALLPANSLFYGHRISEAQLAFLRRDGFNILMHELLHALKFDNLKLDIHHDPLRPSREDDVIFACAAQAYASEAILVDVPACFPGCTGRWPRYANTRRACETCARAQSTGGKTAVPPVSANPGPCTGIDKMNFKLQ
ncbi:MAG TPA: hypothetical protein VFV50_05480 [Bdellovibrionales bacterium]|nr:hypothetical protein [Bdellovibrionales bacterium]